MDIMSDTVHLSYCTNKTLTLSLEDLEFVPFCYLSGMKFLIVLIWKPMVKEIITQPHWAVLSHVIRWI